MEIIKHAHDHTPSLKENAKIQKIMLIALIVISSIFISGFKVEAFSKEEENFLMEEILSFGKKFDNSSSMFYFTDEQLLEVANYYKDKGYSILISGRRLYICNNSGFKIKKNEDGGILLASEVGDEYFVCLKYYNKNSNGNIYSATFGVSFFSSFSYDTFLEEITYTNRDLLDFDGNVVFRKPVEPIITPQLVGVLPEKIMEDGGKILPVGLVIFSTVLLTFLLIRWKKSLSL